MRRQTFIKIFIISTITSIALVIIAIILYIILSVLIVNGLARDARKAYEAARTEVVEELDSFINVNDRLPHSLSELGYGQTMVAYDLEDRYNGVYEFQIVEQNGKDYILLFKYRNDTQEEYYYSKEKKWYDVWTTPKMFVLNDTLLKIREIYRNFKYHLPDSTIAISRDSIRVNSNKATPANYRCDSILYLKYKHLSSQMSMEGWAMSDGGKFLLPYEFGEWVYRDAEGNTYRKFWNYREGDSLIFKPDLPSKLIHKKKK